MGGGGGDVVFLLEENATLAPTTQGCWWPKRTKGEEVGAEMLFRSFHVEIISFFRASRSITDAERSVPFSFLLKI